MYQIKLFINIQDNTVQQVSAILYFPPKVLMVKTYKSAPDNNQTARVSSPSQSEQMSTELGLYKIVVRFPCGLQRECVRSYHIQPNHDVIQTNYMACNRGKQSCVTQDSRLGLDVGGLGPKMREALKSQALDSEKRILQTIKGFFQCNATEFSQRGRWLENYKCSEKLVVFCLVCVSQNTGQRRICPLFAIVRQTVASVE
ncbi:Hypothetical_protein [Hexamita inflata]|uniref:Hypothetical_protein n=1 Tax=Hexamita inflata TaxID=28002 RepID=A0AA86PC40_9EUKA|nr:Hypothetical protein HINF_LOCUS23675 [Hexamita inflata]CAI9936031.1 Hypothetical protein HINF_LOCUS23676 [Hexamita inflata]